jgi:intracellular sulfur oxidation DsrE/DsrF family protein
MIRIENAFIVMVGIVALLVMAPPAAAQLTTQATVAQPKMQAAVAPQKKASAPPQVSKRPVAAKSHRLILQVNSNEPAMLNLALNYATNVAQYYKELGEDVKIDIVAFGPGLHMLRDDTSPVKARIKTISESTPSIAFEACSNTRENMSKAESKDVPLIAEAKIVKSGVVRIMELQEQGWSYVKP